MEPNKPILIRLDDIGIDHPNDRRIISSFCERGLRITCGVVPAWLTRRCTEYLSRTSREFPGCLEVHQHGYAHVNHAGPGHFHHEFGSSRSFEQQLHDIVQGRQILEKRFGALFFPAFCPPFEEFDQNTLIALEQSRFKVISSHVSKSPECTLRSFSPDIDCFIWHPYRQRSWDELVEDWLRPTDRRLRGVVLHPALMTSRLIDHISQDLPELIGGHSCMTFAQLFDLDLFNEGGLSS